MWPGFLFFLLLLLRVHREPFPLFLFPLGEGEIGGGGTEAGYRD